VEATGILLLSAIALAGTAFSQTPTTIDAQGEVNYSAIISALIDLVFPIVVAVATYLINAKVKNQQMATLLSNAVQNGLGTIQQRTAAKLQSTDLTARTASPDIAAGVQYVLDNAAEAIRHFNIPPDRVAEKLVAKLGLAEIATNLATTASPVPVIAGPLAPIPTTNRIEATPNG
jgi:hypothetical protein